MVGLVRLLGFLRVATVVPPSVCAGLALMAGVGGVWTVSHLDEASRALGPIVLLQFFAASSGFGVPARRGHYDLPLSRGHHRLHMAVAHCIMSVTPGVASWLALGLVELSVSVGTRHALLSSGTTVAFLTVSLLSWALTAPFPRLAGGIAWLTVQVVAAMLGPSEARADIVSALSGEAARIRNPATALLCPWVMIGHAIGPSEVTAAVVTLVVTFCGTAAACAWIYQMNVPLEAAQ